MKKILLTLKEPLVTLEIKQVEVLNGEDAQDYEKSCKAYTVQQANGTIVVQTNSKTRN